jgi:hypothetical protein
MTHSITDRLLQIKDQLIEWPNGTYADKRGQAINSDQAFKIIEEDLRQILDKILKLPEEERHALRHVIDDFRVSMAERQKEAEENLTRAQEQIALNKGTTKAMKAYGKATNASSSTDHN